MKSILYSHKRGAWTGAVSLALAMLLLSGCTVDPEGEKGTVPSSPVVSSVPNATGTTDPTPTPTSPVTPRPTDPTPPVTTRPTDPIPPVTQPGTQPEEVAYRWNPYVFDRLGGEYEEDARLLADAILSYSDAVTLSTPEHAQTVVDNIAFEFPPAALADFKVTADTVRITYLCTPARHEQQIDAFAAAVNRALATVSKEDSELERAISLYDHVVKNVAYFSTDYTEKEITAFSALVAGKTICYGFSDAFGYLLRQTGMEAHLWRGGTYTFSGFSDHGWCYAKIDGKFYHFDPTWEYSTYKNTKKNSFIYFGLSDKKRFSSLSKECVSGFGTLEEVCYVTNADERLEWV